LTVFPFHHVSSCGFLIRFDDVYSELGYRRLSVVKGTRATSQTYLQTQSGSVEKLNSLDIIID